MRLYDFGQFILMRLSVRYLIDLTPLYILFSQFRSYDDTQEIWSFVFSLKKTACRSNLLSTIT